jgi:hypothetical protein
MTLMNVRELSLTVSVSMGSYQNDPDNGACGNLIQPQGVSPGSRLPAPGNRS